jgi:uncharacterized OB-fold protein
MSDVKKQLPIINASNRAFWEGAKRHELMAYKCLNCGAFYYPAIHCVSCDKPNMEWVKVSGKGCVYSFVVYQQLYHPAWKEDIPYNVSWIKLDEGPLLVSNVVECPNEDISIGMPVEVVFDEASEEVVLPKFKPVR